MLRTVIGTGALLSTVLMPALLSAQECSAGPKCTAAGNRGKAYVQGPAQQFLSGGAGNAGVGAYCVNMVQAEIGRACANEMRALRRPDCASLADQQAQENLRVANASKASAEAFLSSTPNWKTACKFKG